jgi:hypothetical protein
MMFLYYLAEQLHIPVYQIEEMPVSEFSHWSAYYKLKQENAERPKNPDKGRR